MPDKKPIISIKIGQRFRKDLGDVQTLARSIEDTGLLHPVVITPAGELIAGSRRLAAAQLLGWTDILVNVVDLKEIVRGEHDENMIRKDFAPTEIAAIVRAVRPLLEAEAKERMLAGVPGEKVSQGKTREKVAKHTGLSFATVKKIEEVAEAAEREPEKYGALAVEMDRVGRVSGVHRKLVKAQQAEKITAEPPPLPKGPFRVIVVDPPWHYEEGGAERRGQMTYSGMTVEEICAMKVPALAGKDSILWLWTTISHLRRSFEVLDAWGFEYKTLLTWVKSKMGVGDWLRPKTEHCLMATRGKPTILLTNQTTVLEGPVREHSRKPDEFYAMVEKLCPGSKVDLFARQKREGWTVFGHETGKFGAK